MVKLLNTLAAKNHHLKGPHNKKNLFIDKSK